MRRKQWLLLLAFAGLILALDRALYLALATGFARIEVGQSGGMVNRARKVRADVVVVGSSRAFRHYDPRVLSEAFHATVYNAGCDGQGAPYIRGLVDLLLHDYTPRVLLIDADPTLLLASSRSYDRITVLAPFIDESPIIRRLIYDRGRFEPLKYLSKSFRYNNKPLAILGNLGKPDDTISGFVPVDRTMNLSLLAGLPEARPFEGHPESHLIELLRDTIRAAKHTGTQVVLVTSPDYFSVNEDAALVRQRLDPLRKLAADERISYLIVDVRTEPVFRDPALFADRGHLNHTGARLFSQLLVKRLPAAGVELPIRAVNGPHNAAAPRAGAAASSSQPAT